MPESPRSEARERCDVLFAQFPESQRRRRETDNGGRVGLEENDEAERKRAKLENNIFMLNENWRCAIIYYHLKNMLFTSNIVMKCVICCIFL